MCDRYLVFEEDDMSHLTVSCAVKREVRTLEGFEWGVGQEWSYPQRVSP